MKRKPHGIKRTLFLYLLGFCLLLLLLLALFQTVLLEKFYIFVKEAQVKKEVAAISELVAAENWAALGDYSSSAEDLFLEVWSLERGLILSSGSFQQGVHAQLKPGDLEKLFQQLEAGDGAVTRQYQSMNAGGLGGMFESILDAGIIEGAEGSRYAVLVSARLSPVQATVDTLRIQLGVISVIMLALAAGLALLIAKRISGPIVSISRTATRLGKGETELVFKGEGYSEIAELADALTKAAAELSKTEELRRELVSNVSHDLRTPLTLISGYSEMIRDMPEEATPENLQVIIDESNRLSVLVSDLLDLSRLQAGVDEFTMTRFDLAGLASEIAGRMSRFYERDGYRIVSEGAGPVYVEGDRERLAQVIYNFALNAVAHTGADKTVRLCLSLSGHRARLTVADSGRGIAPEALAHIWERYYKADKTYRRADEGSGLGLAIARSILKRHPGVEYGVESSVGVGSSFWFSIKCE